jgi:hypothetical protein
VKNIWDLIAKDGQGWGKVPLRRDKGLKMEKDLQAMMSRPIRFRWDDVDTMILAIGSSWVWI